MAINDNKVDVHEKSVNCTSLNCENAIETNGKNILWLMAIGYKKVSINAELLKYCDKEI